MRLGAWPCTIAPKTLAHKIYGSTKISERHRHRYEVNNDFRDKLVAEGLIICGTSPDDKLVEMIELADHPWFIGVQFHPEFKSRPIEAHPLFSSYIEAALKNRDARADGKTGSQLASDIERARELKSKKVLAMPVDAVRDKADQACKEPLPQ